jgi:tripartite-type tricarboxylate transporter receptor subunit TctC
MIRFSRLNAVLAATSILALAPMMAGNAAAQDAAAFFKGKTVTITVGFGSGGGYGNYCQQLVAHIGRHTPGNPSFICQFMPGAGGVKAANYMHAVAPRDGTMLGMISDYAAVAQLIEPEKIRYDIRDFKWVGVMVPANPALLVRKGATVQKFEDMYEHEVVVGLVGVLAQDGINSRIMNAILGTKIKGVAGYGGTAPIQLAMEQGEVDGSIASWISWKTRAVQQIESGQFIPIAQIGFRKAWDLPDVPLVRDQAKNREDQQVLDLAAASAPFGRSVIVPPNYPPHLLAALRTAFNETMKDKEFLETAKQRNIEIDPSPGEEIEPILEGLMATPQSVIDRFRDAAGMN